MTQIVIYEKGDRYYIYDEAGQCIEPNFNSLVEAMQYCKDNDYEAIILSRR